MLPAFFACGPHPAYIRPARLTNAASRRRGLSCQAESARCEFLEDVIRPSSQVSSSRRHEIARSNTPREAFSTSASLVSLVCLVSGSSRH
jgi:hypothetical protein